MRSDVFRSPTLAKHLLSRRLPARTALFVLCLGAAAVAAGPRPVAAQLPGGLNASLTASPSSATVGQMVTFAYSATPPAVAPPFASITSITVNYGDGRSDAGNTGDRGQKVSGSLTHTYASAGIYTATLSATASNGGSGSAMATVTVSGSGSAMSWLDGALTSWNSPGMAIPKAPTPNQSGNDVFCASQQRPPENADGSALVAAGWRLFGVYQGGWGVRIISGQSDEDGMCRPAGYQYFVFVNGSFAGTVSPMLMDSRTDGAATQTFIDTGGSMLRVDFARYTATDPLCCPSATTEVTYHIDTSGGAPVVVPNSAQTTPNS